MNVLAECTSVYRWQGAVETAAEVPLLIKTRAELYDEVEAAIKSEMLEQVIEAIEKAANTGKIGDGKIFVFDLEKVVRIRTGETDAAAL